LKRVLVCAGRRTSANRTVYLQRELGHSASVCMLGERRGIGGRRKRMHVRWLLYVEHAEVGAAVVGALEGRVP
jgi:hypothetical protein